MSLYKAICQTAACLLIVCAQVHGQAAPGGTKSPQADQPAPAARTGEPASEKKWQESAEQARAALKKDPDDRRAAFGLGTALIQLKRYREALDVLEPMLVRTPNDPALQNNVAWIYAVCPDPATRRPAEAVTLARKAVLALPGDCDIWNTLAEAHFAAGDYKSAQRAAKIAVGIAQETAPSRVAGFWEMVRRCNRAVERDNAVSH